jgi:membrane-associated phospholipid phosphatase
LRAIVIVVLGGMDTRRMFAQTGVGPERRDIATFTGDIWSVWTSPARFNGRDVAATAATIGVFALTTRFDSATRVWMTTHERTAVMRLLSPIREGARVPAYELGSGQTLLPVSGALYIGGRLAHSVEVRDAGLGCAAGHLASLGIRAVSYRLVARARPRVTPNPFNVGVPGSHDWLWHSFCHIANSMACASFLGHRYSLGPLEAIPYAYASVIGLGRMADGEHWASDTILGAIVGFAIGREVADRQLSRKAAALAPAASSPRIVIPIATLSF